MEENGRRLGIYVRMKRMGDEGGRKQRMCRKEL